MSSSKFNLLQPIYHLWQKMLARFKYSVPPVWAAALILLMLPGSFSANAQVSQIKSIFLSAKESGTDVFVTLLDENTFTGSVISVDEESAAVQTIDGIFNFRYERIASVKLVEESNITTRWFKNIAANKLFITQSGRMQQARTGYYQNTFIFISSLSYGVTKNLTLSGSFSMFPDTRISNQLFSGSAKFGVNVSRNVSLSTTASYYTFSRLGTRSGVSTIFGNATYTRKQLDLTGGLGLGVGTNTDKRVIYILGGQLRLTQKFALLTENIMLPDGDNDAEKLFSFGGRFLGRTIAADLGFVAITRLERMYPFVSFTVKL